MATLVGPAVRHRVAEWGCDLWWLSCKTGIPQGTLRNITRATDPDATNLIRVYQIARALRRPNEKLRAVVAEILANNNEGVPEEPPKQPRREPKGPARRQESEDTRKAPRRTARAS